MPSWRLPGSDSWTVHGRILEPLRAFGRLVLEIPSAHFRNSAALGRASSRAASLPWLLAASILLGTGDARAADNRLDAIFPSETQESRVCLGIDGSTFGCADLSSEALPSTGIALGDFNSDGRLDAVIANDGVENRVCLGDGLGGFACSKLNTDAYPSRGVAVGLVNGDNRLDAVFVNGGISRRNDRVCFGDSNGAFSSCRDVSADAYMGAGVALADMNKDGFLDAVFANANNENNRICLGNGNGGFACSPVSADAFPSNDVAIGDFDNDLNLDAVFANGVSQFNRVCFGDGAGGFKQPCQNAGADAFSSTAVALGNVDDDNNLDAVFANSDEADQICLGDGAGGFACNDVRPDNLPTRDVALGDVNGDGKLDAVFAIYGQSNRVCIGDGQGLFTMRSCQRGCLQKHGRCSGAIEPTDSCSGSRHRWRRGKR